MEIWRSTLQLNVQTRASKEGFAELLDDKIKLRIRAAAIDGKASEAIIKVLSKIFRTPKSGIQIVSGRCSNKKIVKIQKPGHLPDLPGLK